MESKDTVFAASTRDLKSNVIPDSVFLMQNLKILSITGMDCDHGPNNCWAIRELPSKIGELIHLEELDLRVNAIQTIPEEIGKLVHLRRLDLSDNVTPSDIKNITRIRSLEYLDLNGCELQKLPDRIVDLKQLKELNAVGNNFSPDERERIRKALPGCKLLF